MLHKNIVNGSWLRRTYDRKEGPHFGDLEKTTTKILEERSSSQVEKGGTGAPSLTLGRKARHKANVSEPPRRPRPEHSEQWYKGIRGGKKSAPKRN